MLGELEHQSRELPAWWSQFLSPQVTDQFERGHSLSHRQIEVLGRIYAEKMA